MLVTVTAHALHVVRCEAYIPEVGPHAAVASAVTSSLRPASFSPSEQDTEVAMHIVVDESRDGRPDPVSISPTDPDETERLVCCV